MRLLLVLIALTFAPLAQAESTAASPFPAVTTLEIDSEVLGEEREIFLSIPDGYKKDGSLPLVIVTDAKSQFPLVSSYIQNQSSDWPRLPPMVVAGIVNTNRNRDFLPRPDANFEGGGDGDNFARFLREEAIPQIESEIGGTPARILFGHSFGGVNAVNILLTDNDLFDAYIAIGTSTWVSERVLFERAQARFARPEPLKSWLYMAVAERDGGATVPDGELFAELFESSAPPELAWQFKIIPETDHFSAVPLGLADAFSGLFPYWEQQGEVLYAAEQGPEAISQWFAQRSSSLGWRFWPHAWDMLVAGYRLNGEGKTAEAIALMVEMHAFHPRQAELITAHGDFLAATGRSEEAEAKWREALAILIEDGAKDPRTAPVRRRLRQAD